MPNDYIPDVAFTRSVIKQLHLSKRRAKFMKGFSQGVSIIESGESLTAVCEKAVSLRENVSPDIEFMLDDMRRRLVCSGARLERVSATLLLNSEDEERIRAFSAKLYALEGVSGLVTDDVTIFTKCGSGDTAIFRGAGTLMSSLAAPWQVQTIYPGEDIIITGNIGAYGAVKLWNEHREELTEAYPKLFVNRLAKKIPDRLPLVESEILPQFFSTAFVPAGDNGIEAALYRLGDRNRAGFLIDVARFPFDGETIELAEHFDLNPMRMASYGAYVIAARDSESLVNALRYYGIPAVTVGKVTVEKSRIIVCGDEKRFVEPPR